MFDRAEIIIFVLTVFWGLVFTVYGYLHDVGHSPSLNEARAKSADAGRCFSLQALDDIPRNHPPPGASRPKFAEIPPDPMEAGDITGTFCPSWARSRRTSGRARHRRPKSVRTEFGPSSADFGSRCRPSTCQIYFGMGHIVVISTESARFGTIRFRPNLGRARPGSGRSSSKLLREWAD